MIYEDAERKAKDAQKPPTTAEEEEKKKAEEEKKKRAEENKRKLRKSIQYAEVNMLESHKDLFEKAERHNVTFNS
jgi:hypothetical protein